MSARIPRRFTMRSKAGRPPRRAAAALSILAAALLKTSPVLAQFVPPSQIEEQQKIEEVIDAAVDAALREHHVPGAVVAVVKDGRLLLAKGYGLADLETRRRVMANETVFRVGSVSKPVTATAVMQLVERGRLDPRADVNAYLRAFRIDARFPRPVTIADLLTHTAGFDVRLIGTAAPSEDAVLPLRKYLARALPARIRPPGEVPAYSNHGYALLGHLVEIASGRPFPDYVEEEILRPLGMRHSGFRFTGLLARAAAAGYEASPDGPRRSAPIHPHIAPAASFSATATDMARFMIAHLEGGRGAADGGAGNAGGPVILGPETIAEMHRRQFGMDPSMPGMTFGFFEGIYNGRRLLMHGGGIRGFMSGLYLWPESRLGLFVSNNGSSVELVWSVFYRVADHCFPAARAAPAPRAGAKGRGTRYAGTYRPASHSRLNLEKAGALREADVRVRLEDDGSLSVFGLSFHETAPGRYEEPKRGTPIVFVEDRDGRVAYMLATDPFFGNEVWERVPWYGSGTLHETLLLAMVAVFLSAPWFSPAGRGAPGLFETPRLRRGGGRHARRLALVACVLNLLFLAGMFLSFRLTRGVGLLYGVPLLLWLSLVLPVGSACLSLLMLVACVRAWKGGHWRPAARLHFTLLTLGVCGFVLFLHYWNLLGFRF